jgi:copper chaperone CopZ
VAVKRALERLEGVKDARVSFEKQEARVRFDPARVTVNRLGFRASLKQVEDSRR